MSIRWSALALLALLALSWSLAPARAQEEIELEEDEFEDEEEEQPFLLVRRKVADLRPLEGKETTIEIEVYNAGSSAATNVEIADQATWPDDKFTVSGERSTVAESIASGATVSLSYKVTPKEAGGVEAPYYTGEPVSVTYQAGGVSKVMYTPFLFFYSFSFFNAKLMQLLELGAKVSMGYLRTPQDWTRAFYVTVAALALWFGLKTYSSIKDTTQKRKRQRALEELQKMQ